MFPPSWRTQALDSLDQDFDLLIVGAGITGCGILFDAAQRGLRVLAIDKGDIASGTSSRSSKLIHGGLRYLKNLQFKVTRDSCRERDRMLALAPHLVEPIRFVYPAYRQDRTPGWAVGLGLSLYDHLAGAETRHKKRHSRLDRDAFAEIAPNAPQAGLGRVMAYTDAVTDDARLTLATAATAFAHGGQILTRTAPEEAIRGAGGRLAGLKIRDLESGLVHRVKASLVVNATGVWVDELRRILGFEGRRVRPSRGSHLLFSRERLPLRAALTMLSADEGRPAFFIPHPEGVLVGTTDLFHDGPLDDPRPTRGEVDFLLRATARAFPGDPPVESDIRGAFAGLRPVLDRGATDPRKASREEAIWHEEGLLSVAGGKLTTWRRIAEEVVDEALKYLPAERLRRVSPCATARTPLVGAADAEALQRLISVHGAEPEIAEAMVRRLGSLAQAAVEASEASELRPLIDDVDLCAAEVRAHLRYGATMHLDDLLLRRVRIGMWRPEIVRDIVPALRSIFLEEQGSTVHSGQGSRQRSRHWEEELEMLDAACAGWRPISQYPSPEEERK